MTGTTKSRFEWPGDIPMRVLEYADDDGSPADFYLQQRVDGEWVEASEPQHIDAFLDKLTSATRPGGDQADAVELCIDMFEAIRREDSGE